MVDNKADKALKDTNYKVILTLDRFGTKVTDNHETLYAKIDITDSIKKYAEWLKENTECRYSVEEIAESLAQLLSGQIEEGRDRVLGIQMATKDATYSNLLFGKDDIYNLKEGFCEILDVSLVNAKQNAAAKKMVDMQWTALLTGRYSSIHKDRV